MKKNVFTVMLCAAALSVTAQSTTWPAVRTEMKPGARWWWMGSAVDPQGLVYNIAQYAEKGLGELEITPIYGVQGNHAEELQFLSPEWMEAYKYAQSITDSYGMKLDMNTGTGWPFGGPTTSIMDAATKAVFEKYTLKTGERLAAKIEPSDPKQLPVATLSRVMAFSDKGARLDLTDKVADGKLDWTAPAGQWQVIALFNGKTLQMVKRAAPGGEGYVMDHLSQRAVINYLAKFGKAFNESGAIPPNSFFNDSYEVYGADWSPGLLEYFERARGYKLEMYLPEFLSEERTEQTARIVSDYRQTISEMLLNNFTRTWTTWAHRSGSTTRNQAHGSPANLIDLYGAVDIPEIESFGITDFGIKGLRVDETRKKNDSDLSMLKYASSGAHITGKKYTSSETFTWLTEHFRTSLSQCKPDLDMMFCAGINHVFFHGTNYSPPKAPWPGWKFYASIDMSPTNSIWRDAGPFFEYITRCQSMLQEGDPDNDFLLYLPVWDIWHEQPGRLLLMGIHDMDKRAPKFIASVGSLLESGYDADYISDNYLLSTTIDEKGRVVTEGGIPYKAIIVPGTDKMPIETLSHLIRLAELGATVVFIGNYPRSSPGFSNIEWKNSQYAKIAKETFTAGSFDQVKTTPWGKGRIITGSDYAATVAACRVPHEELKTKYGLHYIRRSNPDGHHYFISALKAEDVEGWVALATQAKSAMLFDPMTGRTGIARCRTQEGRTQVYLKLASGESIILKTFDMPITQGTIWNYYEPREGETVINHGWKLSFTESEPFIGDNFNIDTLGSWTTLKNPSAAVNMGTGYYRNSFTLDRKSAVDWQLDLGDVRESARVWINGQFAGTLWAVPYRIDIGELLKNGRNTIEVEVTNLPANRIADYDRRGVEWRIFNDINIVKLDYKPGTYADWKPVPSGLLGPVVIRPLGLIQEN